MAKESSEVKVKAKDTVTVFGTGVSSHLGEGVESGKIHKVAAQKLVDSGKATWKKAEGKGKKEKPVEA